ncbi:MAG: hypothetical protein LBI39_01575 [Puniceicoccales bacterium]|nr:hypothetical protein [Puniceicoccales bacterium]
MGVIVAPLPKEGHHTVAMVVDQDTPTATLATLIANSGIRTGTLPIKRIGGEYVTSIYVVAYCFVSRPAPSPFRLLPAMEDFANQARSGNLRLTHN